MGRTMTHSLLSKFNKNKKDLSFLGWSLVIGVFLFYPFKTESFYVVDKKVLLTEQTQKKYPNGLVPKEDLIETTKNIDASIDQVQKQTGRMVIDAATALAIKTVTPQAISYLMPATDLVRKELNKH